MYLLIGTVFSGERCGPWASCIFVFSTLKTNDTGTVDLSVQILNFININL